MSARGLRFALMRPGFVVGSLLGAAFLAPWADIIGLDYVLEVLDNLGQNYGEDRYRPSPLLLRRVAAGRKFHE